MKKLEFALTRKNKIFSDQSKSRNQKLEFVVKSAEPRLISSIERFGSYYRLKIIRKNNYVQMISFVPLLKIKVVMQVFSLQLLAQVMSVYYNERSH